MNFKQKLKYIWLATGIFAVVLLIFHWFGFRPDTLAASILALDALMFLLSAPCSLFYVPVAAAAGYYLEINAFAASGVYLNTVFLFVLGFMQWFWIARIWSPDKAPFQKLDLIDGENL